MLEWEVVTADGEMRIANPRKNKDLYWALAGGGGGTYGIVTSMTVKAHPDSVTTVATISWTHDGGDKQVRKWWEAVTFFHSLTPGYTDAGAFSIDVYFPRTFSLTPWFGPGFTAEEANAQLAPLVGKLRELELQHTVNITEFRGYLPAYNAAFGNVEVVGVVQMGGWMIPRSLVQNEPGRVQETLKGIIDSGSLILEITTRPTLEIAGFPDNAVLPAWRDNQLNLVVAMYFPLPSLSTGKRFANICFQPVERHRRARLYHCRPANDHEQMGCCVTEAGTRFGCIHERRGSIRTGLQESILWCQL